MSINILSLKIVLANIINTLTSKKVIWSNQNAPTPDGDYIILIISLLRVIGATDYYSKPDINELSKTQGDREISLSLTCVSENALEILLELINKLELPSNLNLLCENKLAYVNIESEPRDVTANINGSFESRAFCTLVFRISKNYSFDSDDNIGIVKSIGVSGVLNSPEQKKPFAIDMIVEE